MYLSFSYKPEFDTLILHLRAKYGEELFNVDGIGDQLDVNLFAKKFFKHSGSTADVSIDDNANVSQKDSVAFNVEFPKAIRRLNSYYNLWKQIDEMYGAETANNILEAQITGSIYINDATDLCLPYCFNFSTMDIAMGGLPMIEKVKCHPPKYLFSFKSQLEQFLTIASNNVLGATGLADVFIVMAHYVDKILATNRDAHFKFNSNDDIWKYVRETIASLIYTVNQPMRSGNQSPFTNVSIYDSVFLESMVSGYVFGDDGSPSIKTVQRIQRIYLDVMNSEQERTPITFPVTTACISVDKEGNVQDESFVKFIARKNQKWGFINLYCGATSTLSSCCRLRSDISHEYSNSFGAGSSKIGSLGVVTLNLPRIAKYTLQNVEAFGGNWRLSLAATLRSFVQSAAVVNLAKRALIKERIDQGALPLYSHGFMDLRHQYLTTGINGLAEMVEILGFDPISPEGVTLEEEIIDTVNSCIDELAAEEKAKKSGVMFNLEQTPSESSAVKLAHKDWLMGFNKDAEGNKVYHLYSNQFIPLTVNAQLFDRIRIQGRLDKKFSGGAIAHINVEQRVSDPEIIYKLIKLCARKGIVYWAINYNIQRCESGHCNVGRGMRCPVCDGIITDSYTRVVGFLTNVKHWNPTRRSDADYKSRIFY